MTILHRIYNYHETGWDESDNLVWQDTPQGKVPQMKKVEYL